MPRSVHAPSAQGRLPRPVVCRFRKGVLGAHHALILKMSGLNCRHHDHVMYSLARAPFNPSALVPLVGRSEGHLSAESAFGSPGLPESGGSSRAAASGPLSPARDRLRRPRWKGGRLTSGFLRPRGAKVSQPNPNWDPNPQPSTLQGLTCPPIVPEPL